MNPLGRNNQNLACSSNHKPIEIEKSTEIIRNIALISIALVGVCLLTSAALGVLGILPLFGFGLKYVISSACNFNLIYTLAVCILGVSVLATV